MTGPEVWQTLVSVLAGLMGVGGAYELWAIFNKTPGDTLSETTRVWFKTNTTAGRARFLAAVGGVVAFLAWFVPHILGG